MKNLFILIIIFVSSNSFTTENYSPLCMDNERVICSFVTKKNKIMTICCSKDESYIVYRYGTKNKIELEYPEDKKDSWSKFIYYHYLRGGGAQNEGLDITYICFFNKGIVYIVFFEFYAPENIVRCGIRIRESKNEYDYTEGYFEKQKNDVEITGNVENKITPSYSDESLLDSKCSK